MSTRRRNTTDAHAFRPSLIAIDLDGTLLRSDRTVSPRAKRAIARLRASGVDVIACTGRPPRRVRAIAADLGLARAIVYNGSATFHAGGQSGGQRGPGGLQIDSSTDVQAIAWPEADAVGERIEVHRQMPREVVLEAIAILRATFPDVMCGIETDHGWYLDDALVRSKHHVAHPDEPSPDGVGDVCDFVRDGVVKLLVRHPFHGAREVANALSGAPVYRTWTTSDLLEVLSDGVNKQATLQAYAASVGVSRERVAAFGDQHNDREMLAWVGLGVAMANGSEEAQAAADVITGTNDEDGVAVLLEAWSEGITTEQSATERSATEHSATDEADHDGGDPWAR